MSAECAPAAKRMTTLTILLLTPIVAFALWIALNFLNEWLLQLRSSPGSRLPPMPPLSSIRGHVQVFSRDFHRRKCIEWAREYGPVFRLKMNFFNVVILNDLASIKKFCNKKELLCRSPYIFGYRENHAGLSTMNGDVWLANRKFCMSLLHGSGFARTVERYMADEFGRLAEIIGESYSTPVKLGELLMSCALNNVASFVYGAHLAHDHPTRRELRLLMKQVGLTFASSSLQQFLPRILRRLLAWLPHNQNYRLEYLMKKMDAVNTKQIEEYKRHMHVQETPDFILEYTRKIEESNDQREPLFTDHYLVGNINSFLLGGTLSVTRTMMWHMLNFAAHPDTVQARVQREIDNVVGRERQPLWEDRKEMPYTLACVWEMERWKTAPTLGISRICAEDVVVDDFFIPKGTIVVPNFWAVHNDPALWQEPFTFRPERYLNEDGTLLPHKPGHLISFNTGRRACPAETFATVEMFLMIAIVLQKYRILPEHPIDRNMDSPDFEISPFSPIKLCFLPRVTDK